MWPEEGASGSGSGSGEGAGAGTPPPATTPAPPATPGAPGDNGGAGPTAPPPAVTLGPDGKPWDPERAGRTIEAMREERRKEKEEFEAFKTKQAQQMDGIARALGLKEEDQLTPEKFQQELTTRDSKITELEGSTRKLRLQIAVDRIAITKDAIGELVWAHLNESGGLADLDTSAKDFEETVGKRIDDALKRYPQLRRTGHAPGDAARRGAGEAPTGSVNDMIRSAHSGRR